MAELGMHHHGLMYWNMNLQHVSRVTKKQQWASGNGDLDHHYLLPTPPTSIRTQRTWQDALKGD